MSSKDCFLAIKVVPNASKTEIVGWLGEALKVRLQAVPEDGKANKVLLKLMSKTLGINRAQVMLESGDFSPIKRIRLRGLTELEVAKRLGAVLQTAED